MPCLRVRLVTGLSEAQGISRDDNRIVPRNGRAGDLGVMPARFDVAKAPERDAKAAVERHVGALFVSVAPRGAPPSPFGETEMRTKGGPGA
jgi:hypothetical protein